MSTYPMSIFCIIATELCERFSFCGLRTILSLYLRNILCLSEHNATVIYHVFIMICYTMPLLGAILADSYLGRYSVILYFCIVYFLGTVFTCLATIPPLQLPQTLFSMIGLLLIAAGTGGIKPCVAAFGGDQFQLPEQNELLRQFFTIFYFTVNFGGFVGMMVTPIARQSVMCFGDDNCYALGFGLPGILMVFAICIFVSGKPWYKMKKPKQNMIVEFACCAVYALRQKLKHRRDKKSIKARGHWLDYSQGKYSVKLIRDMKIVCSILFLYVPVPLFWSLFDQQGSRWTFQASKMRGELWGWRVMPEQLQVFNPALVLLLLPVCRLLPRPPLLDCMLMGGLLASLAFFAAGILQIALEQSSLQTPRRGYTGLILFNALNCPVVARLSFTTEELRITPLSSAVYSPVPVLDRQGYEVIVKCLPGCDDGLQNRTAQTHAMTFDRMFAPIIIGKSASSTLSLYFMEPNSFERALNGRPRIKIACIGGWDAGRNLSVSVTSSNGVTYVYTPHEQPGTKDHVSDSEFMCLSPGRMEWQISTSGTSHLAGRATVDEGGVYVLALLPEFRTALMSAAPPSSLHMLWLLPQYLLLSLSEILFGVSGLEFSFTQAPKSMKTITLAAWYMSVAMGNLLVILIAQAKIFHSQAHEFFVYSVLLAGDMALFAHLARSHDSRCASYTCSSSISNSSRSAITEYWPLLRSTGALAGSDEPRSLPEPPEPPPWDVQSTTDEAAEIQRHN